jgi:hypothetical protein
LMSIAYFITPPAMMPGLSRVDGDDIDIKILVGQRITGSKMCMM